MGKSSADSPDDRAEDAMKLESAGEAVSEEGDKTDDTSEPKIDPATLRQACYYKIHSNGRNFVRVYAPCQKILDHEIYLFVDGAIRVIPSKYFIPQHLERTESGDIVFMFVHEQELFPLPQGRTYFDPQFDLQVRYSPDAQDVASIVANHPDVKAAKLALNEEKEAFLQAREAIRNFAASQSQFYKGLPPLVPDADTQPGEKPESEDNPVFTPESRMPAMVNILPVDPSKTLSNQKPKSRAQRKKWEAAKDHLLRPDSEGNE